MCLKKEEKRQKGVKKQKWHTIQQGQLINLYDRLGEVFVGTSFDPETNKDHCFGMINMLQQGG